MPDKSKPGRASSCKIPCISLYAVEILLILLLIPGCFKAPSLAASLDSSEFTYQETESGVIEYTGKGMELTPGVYRIHAQRHGDYYENMICGNIPGEVFIDTTFDISLECEDKPFKSLRGNTVRFYDGQDALTFEYYVTDRLVDVRLSCVPADVYVNICQLGQIDIYKTGAGNRIAFVCLSVFIFILNGMIRLRRRILKGAVPPERMAAFAGLAGTAAVALFPYLTDYLIMGADTPLYLLRIEELAKSPENILQCAVNGSVLLYIPVMFRYIGFSVMASYKLFTALLVISAVFISYKSLKSCVPDEYAALIGTMAYILFPWPIELIYTDGSAGLYIMFAAFPPVCSSLWKLLRHGKLTPASHGTRNILRNLCIAAMGVLFMYQGIMLDKNIVNINNDGALNTAGLLPVILPAALGILLCLLYFRLKKRRREFFFIMALFIFISAIYRVNEIAFCSNVYYLYDVGQLGRGVSP